MSDTTWQQTQLSPSRGGLGFRSLSRHSSAAFISSLCSSGFGLQSSHHLSQAIETFNSLVSPADAVSVESLLTSSVSQKYLSGKLDDRVFNMLLNSSSVADKARLLSVSSPHAASWLSVVPSENLGLHLDPPVFQVAIKWWLGLDTSEGSQCALCPGSTLDHLGHHAVTCKYGGDVVSRHNRIRDILVETCRRAHIGVKVEVGNNLSRDHSKTRPADILLLNWFLGRTAALDVSITSPLNPVTLLEAGVSATAAAQATEARKHQANDPKCSELGWVCVPMVVETYGAWGKEAKAIISSVASRLATSTCRPKSTILHEIYVFCRRAHLSVSVEVGQGLSRVQSNSRPADVLVDACERAKPATFDVTVTSPLTLATLHDACNSAGVAAHKAECRKHSSNDPKCQELGWVCVPLAVESYGNWGKEAQNTFARLASILSISLHCPKAKVLIEFMGS
ncbi:hypothetical protein EMCRGX_G019438 [Ephydatia muelleri]